MGGTGDDRPYMYGSKYSGEDIRMNREIMKLNMDEFSQVTGIEKFRLHFIEDGQLVPTIHEAWAIGEMLGMNPKKIVMDCLHVVRANIAVSELSK